MPIFHSIEIDHYLPVNSTTRRSRRHHLKLLYPPSSASLPGPWPLSSWPPSRSAYTTPSKRSVVDGDPSDSNPVMPWPTWRDRESCHESRPSEKKWHPAETRLLESTDKGTTMSSVERSGNKEWSSSRLDPD